ncbi:MAG: hypothetical protein JO053_15935, partial [Acidobacteria bacterium]|nr:hypothetical protein [Acidobacteriota bacterium]
MTKIFRILSALSLVLGGIQVTWSLAGEGPHRAPPLPRAQQIASTNDLELLVAAARTHPERVYSAVLTADVAVPNDRSTSTGEMSLAAQTVTSVNVPSNRLTIPGHGFANGDALVFASTGTLPSPLTAGTPYFCIVIDPNTIELAGQYSYQAVADRSLHLDLTTSGSGRIAVTNKYPQAPGIAQRTLTVVSPLFQPTDIGKWISVSGAGYKGEDLLTTIASYKSPTQVVLLAGTSATIKSSTVKLFYELPKNIIISASDGGTFTGASGGLLAINTGRISVPPVQLFKSFAAGTVKFTDQIPETVYPEWFGAKGDTVLDTYRNYVSGTDDLAAFNAMIASSGKVVGDYTQGTLHIVLSNGKTYYLSDTLNVDTQVLMEGLAGTQNVVPALKFAANKTGIVQHSLSTNTGGYLLKPYRSADFSIFRNFAVLGTVGSTNMNVTVDLETINSIPNTITLNENSGGINMSAGNGFQNGNTITIGSWTYVFDNVQSSTKVTLKKPRLFFYSFSTNGAPTPYIYRGSYDAYVDDWLNQKIRLPDNQVFKIIEIVHSPGEYPGSDRIKLGDVNTGIATNWVPYGNTGQYMGTAYLESLAITSQNATANIYHGMDIRGQTQIENMTIREFAGNGIEGNSQSFPSWNLGNVPNLNNSVIRRNTLYQNKGNGLRMFGINSNQILIEINDSSYNKGAGYMEQSLLGNTYVGNHSSYNTYAPHYADTAANSSLFLNEYEETDGTSSRFGGYNIELGGNLSSGGGIDTLYGSKNWYRA